MSTKDQSKKAVTGATKNLTPTTVPGQRAPAKVSAGFNVAQAASGGVPPVAGGTGGARSPAVIQHDTDTSGSTVVHDTDTVARRGTSAAVAPTYSFNKPPNVFNNYPAIFGPQPGWNQTAPGVPANQPVPSTVAAERAKLYAMPDDQLRALQDQLAHAGFYGDADAEGNFPYTKGKRDNQTVAAVNDWMVLSAREYLNSGKTADDVLDEMVAEHNRTQDLFKQKKATTAKPTDRAGTTNIQAVDLTDPHEVSRIGDQVGMAVLGRTLTIAEKQSLVGLIHSREQGQAAVKRDAVNAAAVTDAGAAQAAAARNVAGTATGTVTPDRLVPVQTTNTDNEGLIADTLRTTHPGEAGAQDLDTALNTALQFIHQGSPL